MVELAFCAIDRRALDKGESRFRIEVQRPLEISEGAIEVTLDAKGGTAVDIGCDLVALGFPFPTGDDLSAAGDPRIEIGVATSCPAIALGESCHAERNAKQPSERRARE
ncbi:hypothetical protein OGR47_19000 (plasmid) [Methylocystis sp. MJC1]|nr:hypothetical protein [Methylocystis sp. MJC1]UZX14104.1 hypothetical protein OGR47_19000 [Methylocystis sp. MJC1]